jgi:hypothetical protein
MKQFVATPTVEECEARIEELEAENERLREALAEIAEGLWLDSEGEIMGTLPGSVASKIAREALKENSDE